MPYWLGYSIYSSQNPSTSVSPSLAAEEKGPYALLAWVQYI